MDVDLEAPDHTTLSRRSQHLDVALNLVPVNEPIHLIVVDNGPEFTSRALDTWAYGRGIQLHFIQPGKPVQNCFIESFNGKVRDECFNEHWFVDLIDARSKIEAWREDYNEVRPHSSLGDVPPAEFARQAA
jgi:putative transposase